VGVPLLIFDDIVGVSDAVTKGIIWSCGAGHAAASLRAGLSSSRAFDCFFSCVNVANELRFCRPVNGDTRLIEY